MPTPDDFAELEQLVYLPTVSVPRNDTVAGPASDPVSDPVSAPVSDPVSDPVSHRLDAHGMYMSPHAVVKSLHPPHLPSRVARETLGHTATALLTCHSWWRMGCRV